MNDLDFKKIFVAHRVDVSDEGFSERVIRQLPERKSIVPQAVMVVFVMIGLTLTFAIQGVTPLLEQINSLITSISHLQAPSPSAVITYICSLAIIGIIGYSVARADAG
jgi:protein-S-isoprenylcysteine O-methyltransferase Ste14